MERGQMVSEMVRASNLRGLTVKAVVSTAGQNSRSQRKARQFNRAVTLAVAAVSFAAYQGSLARHSAASGATMYLGTGGDGSGAWSFNTTSGTGVGWFTTLTTQTGAVHTVTSSNDYVVQSAPSTPTTMVRLRTPTTAGNQTFAGASLTLMQNGVLFGKDQNADIYTINNLNMSGGAVDQGTSAGNVFTLAGTMDVLAGTTSYLSAGYGLVASADANFSISSNMSGSGNLILGDTANDTYAAGSAFGQITLSGNNTGFSGTVSFPTYVASTSSASALDLANTNALANANLITTPFAASLQGSTGLVFNAANTTYNLGGLTGNGNITLQSIASGTNFNSTGGSVTLAVGNNNVSNTYSGVFSGSGNLSVIGTGTFTLNANNTFSGNATVNTGSTLQLNTSNAVQNAAVVLSGGNLKFNTSVTNFAFGGLAGTSNLALADTGSNPISLTVGSNNASTGYSGSMTGGGLLTKIGSGRLTLSGSSSYSGATTINAGGILISGNLSNSAVTVNSGAYLTGVTPGIIGSNVNVATNGSIDFSQDGATTSAQALTVGSLNLSTGTTSTTASRLTYEIQASGAADTLSSPGSLFLNNSSGGSVYINLAGTFAPGTYTLISYANQTGTSAAGVYTNGTAGEPFVIGSNALVGAATYTFNDTNTALTLQIQGATAPTPALAYWYGAYAATTAGGSNATVGTFGGNNGSTLTNFSVDAGGTTDAGQVPGAITDVVFSAGQSGAGGSSLAGANITASLDVNYTINSLTVNNTSATGSTTVGGTGNLTLNAGSGSLYAVGGTGIMMNAGAAPLSINTSGQVIIARNQTWTNASTSPLTISSGITTAATAGTTTLTLNNSNNGNTLLSGTIADNGSGKVALLINNTGLGIASLSGTNSYSGGTNISAGTLSIATDANLGAVPATATANIFLNGGTLQLSSGTAAAVKTINANRSIVLGGTGGTINLAFTNSGTASRTAETNVLNYSGNISGTGGLTILGMGGNSSSQSIINFSGTANYSGNTTINNAVLDTNTGTANYTTANLPPATVLSIVNNGLFFINGTFTESIAGLTGDNTANISTANGTSISTIALTGSGPYTYQGSIGNDVPVSTSGELSPERINLTVAMGAGGMEILTGSNSYGGSTTLTSGTLQLGNATGLPNSTVTMSGGNLNFSTGIGNVTLGGITGTGNLVLSDISSGAVAVSIGSNNASTGYSGNISSGAAAGSSLIKIGTGTTTLSGSDTYVGTTIVSAGTLEFGTEPSLYGANQTSWTPANIQVSSGAVLGINLNTGGFSTADASTLIGNLSANSTGGGFSAGAFAGLDYSGTSTVTLTSVIADSNAGSLGLVKLGTGVVALTGSNTYTGGTNISNGTLVFGSPTAFGASGTVTESATGMIGLVSDTYISSGSGFFNLANYSMNYVSGTGITFQNYNSSLSFTNIATVRLGAAAGTPSGLLGNVSGATSLSYVGPGTLTLAGTVQSNQLLVRQGTLILSGSNATVNATVFSSVGYAAGDNASLVLQNGAVLNSTSDLNISDQGGATPNTGLVTIADSASGLTVTNLYVGKGGTGTTTPVNNAGTLNQLAGSASVSGIFQIGVYGNGTYNLSGGTLTLASGSQFNMGMQLNVVANLNITGTGVINDLNTTAGNTGPGSLYLVNSGVAGTTANMTLAGNGAFNASNEVLTLGQFGAAANSANVSTATLTMAGISTLNVFGIKLGGRNGTSYTDSVINMNGGTIVTGGITFGNDLLAASFTNAVINSNGGTIQASAANTSFFAGDVINLQAGGINLNTAGFAVTNATNMSGVGGFTKSGPGSLNVSGTNTYSGSTNVSGGVLIIQQDSALPTGNSSNSAIVGLSATLIAPDQAAIIRPSSLNMLGNAIVHNGSIAVITAMVKAGYNNGNWNGTNTGSGVIASSSAAADSSHLTAVGVITGLTTTFEGQSVVSTDVLIKDTYYGDTNLDGTVDGSDYSRIDNAALANLATAGSATGWFNGDFNYDGVIDGSDYTLIDNAFNTQGAQISAQVASPTAQIAGSSAVPEPTSIGIIGVSIMGLLSRRRRKARSPASLRFGRGPGAQCSYMSSSLRR